MTDLMLSKLPQPYTCWNISVLHALWDNNMSRRAWTLSGKRVPPDWAQDRKSPGLVLVENSQIFLELGISRSFMLL